MNDVCRFSRDHVVECSERTVLSCLEPVCLSLYHYVFIISQLWSTSYPRSTVVLLDTGTPGTSREIYSEDADGETRAIELVSSMARALGL